MINKAVRTALLKRRPDTNKGDYGHVFVIAGSVGMTGAAYLAAQAALLSGSGLVTAGIPRSLNIILSRKTVEVMTRPLPETKQQTLSLKAFPEIERFIKLRRPDVLAVGPGLSQNKETQALIRKVISKIDLPMVIDADGLNAFVKPCHSERAQRAKNLTLDSSAAFGSLRMTYDKIITPHPGEMARLLGISVREVQKDRKNVAKKVAADYNVITVLKGHRTIVADPGGRVYINKTGNPGMASAGCGDVLTGMIASFMGQGIKPFEAARLGVYLHGRAGDLAAKQVGQVSLKATDLLKYIPSVIKSLATSRPFTPRRCKYTYAV